MVEFEIGGRDLIVLRALMRQYWLWAGLSQPRDWQESQRYVATSRVRAAFGIDTETPL